MKFGKKTIGIVMAGVLIASMGTKIYADPSADSLNQQKQQLENQKKQNSQNMQQSQLNADSAQKDINNLNSQIQMLDSKIGKLQSVITDTNVKITAKEAEIQVSQNNLDKAQADFENGKKLFAQRMRVMYEGEYDQFLDILFSSKDFGDLLTKADDISTIMKHDDKLAKELVDKKEKIQEVQASLEKEKNDLIAFKQDNEKKLAEVQSAMQSQQKLIAEAKSRQAYYMSQISDYKNKIAAEDKAVQDTLRQLQALALQANNQQNNNGVPPAPNAIVAYAYNFLGDPYVWGAEGDPFTQADINLYAGSSHDVSAMKSLLGKPAFDCSGLMQYVYAHFGVHIARTTYDQINDGTPVDRSNLQPGDLIFFGTYSDPHHVGMYVGNNCYIQAPFSGDVVRVSSLDDTDEYLCARRILK